MEETITLTEILRDESGHTITIERQTGMESSLDLAIANNFHKIRESINHFGNDEEMRTAEKFRFARHLLKFMDAFQKAHDRSASGE